VRTGLSLQITRENKTMKLKIGDPAPQFNATATDGGPIKLSDYFGKKLVLYFYPMDDTPGCTKQACSLRDHYQEIQDKDASILGVSTQDVAAHQRFTEKYNLPFPLVADTDGAVSRAYGAIGGGGGGLVGTAINLFGVANRITFLIDESGHIAHIIDHPDTAHHAEEILKLL
jgi:peroxiredoxin Q/BCP